MKIGGVDEAGKGPVFGPMCVACVVVDEDEMEELRRMGVRDSKKLSPKKRKKICEEITERFETKVLKISPQKIDKMREEMSMDWIMVHAFAHLVKGVDVAYVDAADVDAERFGKRISELVGRKIKIISMHKADEKIPVVSAASIVAKV